MPKQKENLHFTGVAVLSRLYFSQLGLETSTNLEGLAQPFFPSTHL